MSDATWGSKEVVNLPSVLMQMQKLFQELIYILLYTNSVTCRFLSVECTNS